VLGASYLPKAIGCQSRLSSVEEPASYPPTSFQSWHIITSVISALLVRMEQVGAVAIIKGPTTQYLYGFEQICTVLTECLSGRLKLSPVLVAIATVIQEKITKALRSNRMMLFVYGGGGG